MKYWLAIVILAAFCVCLCVILSFIFSLKSPTGNIVLEKARENQTPEPDKTLNSNFTSTSCWLSCLEKLCSLFGFPFPHCDIALHGFK